MRDSEVYRQLENSNKRVAMIYRQMVFIDTRLQAFESAISEPWAGLKGLFMPENILRRVNKIQMQLMKKHDDELNAQIEAEKKAQTEAYRPTYLSLLTPDGVIIPNGQH